MDWLHEIIGNTQMPVVTAFLLGLVVALHPCPLAANIAAMGYIASDMGNGRRVLMSGLFYTLGRVLAYSLPGIVLVAIFRSGANLLELGGFFGKWGERLLSPILVIIGVYFILSCFLHRHEHNLSLPVSGLRFRSLTGSLLIGMLLALSFCPESAIVYFGMLMPLAARDEAGWLLPVVFSLATAIPSVLMAWAVAYGISRASVMRKGIHAARKWMGVILGLIFMATGILTAYL